MEINRFNIKRSYDEGQNTWEWQKCPISKVDEGSDKWTELIERTCQLSYTLERAGRDLTGTRTFH